MIRGFLALPAALALLCATSVTVLADDVMLVLDASASMAGKLGRDRKIDLVADSVAAAVADFPTEARIGVLAFGAKSKTSCTDAEIAVRPQRNGNDLVAAAAATLKPRGKAPLAVAVERAANALDYKKARATVIVFVDKVEACDANPCVLAESLAERAKDLTVEVIGLGLDDKEIEIVACLAEKTGGKFINAKDGTDVAGGLAAALAAAKAPPPNLPSAHIEAPAKVIQSSVFDVAYDGPKAKGDRVQIVWPGLPAGSEIRSVLVAQDGKMRKLRAPAEPGTYEIRYYHPQLNVILATQSIEVDVRPTTVNTPERVGAGAPFSVAWSGPAAPSDAIEISPEGADTKLAVAHVNKDGRALTLTAPITPGRYEARYRSAVDNTVAAKASFTVDPPMASLSGPETAKPGSAITVEWKGPAARFDDVVIARVDMPAKDYLTTARIRPDRPTVHIAVPSEAGSYELRYIAGDGTAIFARAPLRVR
ncbi:vWA domain-containing protein [Kaistia terrae]|uniref:VWA domain-containing protein n=1 Tax=Kaistia terrae TaxID=537017 RepID=A0ABW0PVG2_9HYPH|nr:VWA domain-containing protein [Kaistia terrae]MCX5579611.1 VWA domain-containing protein [Kaistia terrae]